MMARSMGGRRSGCAPAARNLLPNGLLLCRINRETDMFKKLVACALLAGGLTLAACNTVEGVGKDVSSVGNAAADAAK